MGRLCADQRSRLAELSGMLSGDASAHLCETAFVRLVLERGFVTTIFELFTKRYVTVAIFKGHTDTS